MTELSSAPQNDPEELLNNLDSDIDIQIKELKHDYHEILADHPEILKYIERLHTIIRRQQKKLNKFYNKLKDHRFVRCNGRTNVATQTEEFAEESDPQKTVAQTKPEVSTPLVNSNVPWNSTAEGANGNIVDEVKEAAESAMKQTSFVYEPTSGMYYDYSTGYYYNAELRLYYDGNSGKYLIYDEETKQYKYHTADGSEDSALASQMNVNKHTRKKKPKARQSKKFRIDDTEEGEITESSGSGSGTESSSDVEDVRKPDAAAVAVESGDAAVGCDPCIRIMVEETNVDKLRLGSLFVVTCTGGTMGREGDHAVLIPDINVSKHHARFEYNEEVSKYFITDLGSRNGTWLDGERLSAALQESEAFELQHGAIIQVGGTKLLCHVHAGRDTCASCEPGLVQQPAVLIREPSLKHPEYKEQLQNLKKKFGIDSLPQDVFNVPGYEDRAEIRRSTVGSSHHSEKTQSASLTESISQSNKGFKMLAKMGWSEGQKLGKDDRGLSEPVSLISNQGSTGLGASAAPCLQVTPAMKKKQAILKKTRDRYRNIREDND